MSREKSVRKLNFKPSVKNFIPKDAISNGKSTLLHEEIEAIYLMDVLGLYQEEAAKSMEVSRPTFTRILKGARQKLATALVGGYEIEFQDDKDDFIVAVCSSSKDEIVVSNPLSEYILIYRISKNKEEFLEVLKNPVHTKKQKPPIAIPASLLENRVNIFVASKVGEGLKSSLNSKGIRVCMVESLKSLTSICGL